MLDKKTLLCQPKIIMEISSDPYGKPMQELRAETKIAYRHIIKQVENDAQKTFSYIVTLGGIPNLDKGRAMIFVSPISPKNLNNAEKEQKFFLLITDYGLKEFKATPELEEIVNKRLDLQLKGEKFPKEDPGNAGKSYEGYEDKGFVIIDPDTNQRVPFIFPFPPDVPIPDPEDLKTAIVASKSWVKNKVEKSPEAQERKETITQLQNAESVSNVLNETLGFPSS